MKNAITADDIKKELRENSEFTYRFLHNNDYVTILYDADCYTFDSDAIIEFIGIYYTEEDLDYSKLFELEPKKLINKTQYFHIDDIDYAISRFLNIINAPDIHAYLTSLPQSIKPLDILVMDNGLDYLTVHYDYLDRILGDFWKLVFNKTLEETWNSGIIAAHGDKGRGYKKIWEEAGISFNRGMMLYLLTYTEVLGDTPKHESKEWVINNYLKYLPLIEEAERKYLERITQ